MPLPESQALRGYTKFLGSLLKKGYSAATSRQISEALGTGPAEQIRRLVSLRHRRRQGMFFTGQELGRRLISAVPDAVFGQNGLITDPACGAGDLILHAAGKLPIVASSLHRTLRSWGKKLAFHDIVPELVDITLLRLALLALNAGASSASQIGLREVRQLFPHAGAMNGMAARKTLEASAVVLLNPPFTSVAVPPSTTWTSGRASKAGIFLDRVLRNVNKDAYIAAILPDVLRSGSRYEKWRQEISTLFLGANVRQYGLFDDFADVDVFLLFGKVGTTTKKIRWLRSSTSAATQVSDFFDVRVGSVVPHRSPHQGKWYRYLHARNLPTARTSVPRLESRRFPGTTFKPPFVVIRRTSRPGDALRSKGVLVTGERRVAVENHLLVCTPKDGRRSTCEALLNAMEQPSAARWFDEAIRCRHLTVGALSSCPIGLPSFAKAS